MAAGEWSIGRRNAELQPAGTCSAGVNGASVRYGAVQRPAFPHDPERRSRQCAASADTATTVMRGITCLLSGTPQAPGISSLPGGTLSGQLIWLLESMERTADRLDAIAPRTSGLVRSLLLELAQQQRQSWSRAIALLGSALEG